MGFDPRLKASLRRDADSIDPNVEWGLVLVERGHRRGGTGRALGSLAAVAFVGVLAVFVIAYLEARPAVLPGASPSASLAVAATSAGAPAYMAIAGTYAASLAATAPNVASNSLTGGWTMTLGADGAIGLAPPPGFTAEGRNPTGNAFTLTGSTFRTNMFANQCDSVGAYTWSRSGGQLTFMVLTDACIVRTTLLTTSSWHEGAPPSVKP